MVNNKSDSPPDKQSDQSIESDFCACSCHFDDSQEPCGVCDCPDLEEEYYDD